MVVVCVTGGSGYLASSLIRKLLLNGHTVHATVRNLNDESKVGFLKSLPNASTNLVVFEADIYEPHQFEAPIRGSHFVFHVATPMRHTHGSKYKNTGEASVATAKKIGRLCAESGTVRRLIYTASVVSMSPMEHDGSGNFKQLMDETCWTPLHFPFSFPKTYTEGYIDSKTLTEKAIVEFGDDSQLNSAALEVVSLVSGLIVGHNKHCHISETTIVAFSQYTHNAEAYYALRCIEDLNGKVPLVHIEDVCEAHVFCMEQSSIRGRFLCASSFLSSSHIAGYYRLHHPQMHQKQGDSDEVPIRNIKMNSEKLTGRGFKYKYYDDDTILEHIFQCYKQQQQQQGHV